MSMFGESLRAFLRPVLEHLDDPDVSEIMINGPDDVWIERHGLLERTAARFTDDGLMAAARNMAQYVGRPLSEEHPRLDARLPDGSRIHVILPPMARCGAVISIRKFFPGGLSIDDLIEFQTVTPEAARLLEVVVLTKKNVMVAGGTGSGKTTLLNVLSQFIPDDERILTIEDSAELQLSQTHLVPLEARPPDRHGRHAVTIRDLLHSALRLRPDRIVIGEVRGGECFDLLQAMNTGHGGMLSTCHANSALETLSRVESLALLADVGLPLRAVRAQVASAINVVVCTGRLRDGSRKITTISEVLPLDAHGNYRIRDLFVFTQTQAAREGDIHGYLAPTGLVPTFQGKLLAEGFSDLAPTFFAPETYGYQPPPHFVGGPSDGEREPPSREAPRPAPEAPRPAPEAPRPAPEPAAHEAPRPAPAQAAHEQQQPASDNELPAVQRPDKLAMAATIGAATTNTSSSSVLSAPAALPKGSSVRAADDEVPVLAPPRRASRRHRANSEHRRRERSAGRGPAEPERPRRGQQPVQEPPAEPSRPPRPSRSHADEPMPGSRGRATAAGTFSSGQGRRRATVSSGGSDQQPAMPASMPAPPIDARHGDRRAPEQRTNPDIDLQELYGMHRDGQLQGPPTDAPPYDPAYDPSDERNRGYGDPIYDQSPEYTEEFPAQDELDDPFAVDEGEPTRFRPRPKPGE